MKQTNERAAPSPKSTASKTNGREHTTAEARGASPARRFGPNVGQLVLIALAMAGGLTR